MIRLTSTLCAAAIAATVPMTTPALSMPMVQPDVAASNVVKAQYDGRIVRRGGHYYFNGHRGYRHRRHGYREYNGWWFPAGAFIAGAIIGGALAAPDPYVRYRPRYYYDDAPRVYYRGGGNAHVAWCYQRYRSYREWDNTFQPYHGPRRPCYSPYS